MRQNDTRKKSSTRKTNATQTTEDPNDLHVTILNLAEKLKEVHPSDIKAGVAILGWFAHRELQNDNFKTPSGGPGSAFSATEDLAWCIVSAFSSQDHKTLLGDYGKLLTMVYEDLVDAFMGDTHLTYTTRRADNWEHDAMTQIERIAKALGLSLASEAHSTDKPPEVPAAPPAAGKVVPITEGWTKKAKRFWPGAVAACSGLSFSLICGGWRSLASLLALSCVAAPVWILAKRHAAHAEVAPQQPEPAN